MSKIRLNKLFFGHRSQAYKQAVFLNSVNIAVKIFYPVHKATMFVAAFFVVMFFGGGVSWHMLAPPSG